jgi:hypothetical protein
MIKLYPVRIVYDTMIAAEQRSIASKIVRNNQKSILSNSNPINVIVSDPVENVDDIPVEWKLGIPWGDNEDDLNCTEIVRMSDKEIYIDRLTENQKNKILSKMTVEQINSLLYDHEPT